MSQDKQPLDPQSPGPGKNSGPLSRRLIPVNGPGQRKPQPQKRGQSFLSWQEAMEYEMRSSWIVFILAGCNWKWVRRLQNRFLLWSFQHKYSRYAAQKSALPPAVPK